MLNKTIFIGRCGKEPELRKTPGGTSVCTISLACDRDFKDESGNRETDWIDVTLWREKAEFFCKTFHKGDTVCIEGKLQSRRWTDKNGSNRIAWEVQADSVHFCGKLESHREPVQEIEDDGEVPF